MAKVRAFDKNIKLGPDSGGEGKQGRRKAKRIPVEDFDLIRSQLQKGEYLLNDGRLMYKVPRSMFSGAEAVKSITAGSLDELRVKEKQLLDSLKNNSHTTEAMSLNELYTIWKKLKMNTIESSTMRNYIYSYEQHVSHSHLGDSRICDIRKSTIRAFYNNIIENRLMRAASLHTLHSALLQIFEVAVDDLIIPVNPASNALKGLIKLDAKKYEKAKNAPLTIPEQAVFLYYLKNNASDPKWYNLFGTLLGTGMRIAELCALQWENVDFEKNEITIEHSLAYFPHKAEEPTDPKEKLTYKSCYYEMHEPKTKAGKRTIPMFNFVRECLLAEKKRQEDYGIKCSIHVQGYSNFVFLNRYNRPYEPPNLPTALKRQIRHCNMYNEDHGKTDVLVPNVTCHAFRHTFACRLIEGCIHPIVVQKMMGHEDISTLMNIYVECQDSFANKELGISSDAQYDNIFDAELPKQSPESLAENYVATYSNPSAAALWKNMI